MPGRFDVRTPSPYRTIEKMDGGEVAIDGFDGGRRRGPLERPLHFLFPKQEDGSRHIGGGTMDVGKNTLLLLFLV